MRTTHLPGLSTAARLPLAIFVGCLLLADGFEATAGDLCGTTIVEDVKLDSDLVCPAAGLIVGADGIRINLNGHTIMGAGSAAGIDVIGRHDISIHGGTITKFAVAVRVNTSSDLVISHIEFVANGEGIDLQAGSVANTIKQNYFRSHTMRAIMLRTSSSGNDIKHNTFEGNRVGILLFGGVDNILRKNSVSGSTLAGIRLNVIATGNLLKDNLIASNVAGVEFLVTPTGSAIGNDFARNTIELNDCGLKGPTAGNSFTNNSFGSNGVDICP
jgi:parallel beta-helix repeat protein